MASPILSVEQMRQWEQATWQAGNISEQEVIARVGELVAVHALTMTARGDEILLLVGKGHNGDDVRLSQSHLKDRKVELLEVTDPTRCLPELADALKRRPTLIVDGLFGIGLNRPLDDDWKTFIGRVNQSKCPVLAVDSPSGLNCQTGKPEGTAIKADVTLTLGAIKRGLIEPGASEFVGQLIVEAEIGLIPCPIESEFCWTTSTDFKDFPPRPPRDAHKGSFGHLVIVAGSLGYHGAAVLAARAAQAAHPGLITVVTTDETYVPVASQLQSVMVRPWTSDWEPSDKTSAILFGPGLADPTVPTGLRKQVLHFWEEFSGAVVADASGLDWLTNAPVKSNGCRVVTPHPGEAARMLVCSVSDVQKDRTTSVRNISAHFGGTVVVLKGHHSLVGSHQGTIYVNSTGGPRLGQGGSGDILGGYLAGLLAQPALARDPVKSVRYAVWRHGLAGDSKGWNGFVEDLPAMLAASPRLSEADQ